MAVSEETFAGGTEVLGVDREDEGLEELKAEQKKLVACEEARACSSSSPSEEYTVMDWGLMSVSKENICCRNEANENISVKSSNLQ